MEGEDQWKRWALKIKTFLGPEMATSETHVHKIINVPVLCMALVLNDFDTGKYITIAIGRVGPEIGDFDSNKSKSLRSAPYKQQIHK